MHGDHTSYRFESHALQFISMYRADCCIFVLYKVRLLEAGRFQTVGRHMLDPGEEPCSVAAERLHNAATGALEPYVIVGTALDCGEDYPCSGRVLLFRVSRSDSTGTSTAEPPWEATLLHARCRSPRFHCLTS